MLAAGTLARMDHTCTSTAATSIAGPCRSEHCQVAVALHKHILPREGSRRQQLRQAMSCSRSPRRMDSKAVEEVAWRWRGAGAHAPRLRAQPLQAGGARASQPTEEAPAR